MSFKLDCFSTLVSKYNSWDSLRSYLTSDDGGKLRVISNDDSKYALVRYTRGVSNMDVPHVPMFRSVVWDKTTNLPVSVAPVQSQEGFPSSDSSLHVSEFLDGTMIHAFCSTTGDIHIATRSVLDAENKYYTNKTFSEMLSDVTRPLGGTNTWLSSFLTPGQFACLLIQHPDHKTVTSIARPRLYVTHTGAVTATGGISMTYSTDTWQASILPFAPTMYHAATKASRDNVFNMLNTYNPVPNGHTWQGLVFQDTDSSARWRIRTKEYMYVRALRGQEALTHDRFLRLRSTKMVHDYLAYFPEDSRELWACEKALRSITDMLNDAYISVFKLKKTTFKDYHVCLRPHLYALHGKYLASFPKDESNTPPTSIRRGMIIEYVNSLDLYEQGNLMKNLMKSLPKRENVPRAAFVNDDVDSSAADAADAADAAAYEAEAYGDHDGTGMYGDCDIDGDGPHNG